MSSGLPLPDVYLDPDGRYQVRADLADPWPDLCIAAELVHDVLLESRDWSWNRNIKCGKSPP
jgi:hypothetical protein